MFVVRRDGSGGAVDGHQLPGVQAQGGVAGGDDGGCSGEQWRPCRCGGFCDKHITVAELAEVSRAVHDAYRSGGAARRCRMPDDHTLATRSAHRPDPRPPACRATIDIEERQVPFFMSTLDLARVSIDVLVGALAGDKPKYPTVTFDDAAL